MPSKVKAFPDYLIQDTPKKQEIGIVKKQDILEKQAKFVYLALGSNLGNRKNNIEIIFTYYGLIPLSNSAAAAERGVVGGAAARPHPCAAAENGLKGGGAAGGW